MVQKIIHIVSYTLNILFILSIIFSGSIYNRGTISKLNTELAECRTLLDKFGELESRTDDIERRESKLNERNRDITVRETEVIRRERNIIIRMEDIRRRETIIDSSTSESIEGIRLKVEDSIRILEEARSRNTLVDDKE